MATETIVRSSQPIRRREASRSLLGKRAADAELNGSSVKRSRTFNEPFVRDSQYILQKHKGKQPSLKIHLHDTHFRFDGQDGSFGYDSPMRFVLKHLQTQTVPHDMLEELLASGVPFYDSCLIVEVHNHRNIDGQKSGIKSTHRGDDREKFSIHNWNPHVTPSAGASFPDRSELEPEVDDAEEAGTETASKQNNKREPSITTIVLHPTEQTRHEEMLILARTPALDSKRRKGAEGSVPPTPALNTPSTPSGSSSRISAGQKMSLDQGSLYSFQSEMLVATEPPLLLDPAENIDHAYAILDALQHPLHSSKPVATRERKRTTAEMAADDAQAAENERRMLIMDERIKPSARSGAGNTGGENQATAASLGFSRFKTIENVKQRLKEQERVNKEKEQLAAQEKRQQEEQAAVQHRIMQQQAQQQAAKQKEAQEAHARRQLMVQQQQQQKHAQQVAAAQQAHHQSELMKQITSQQQNMMQNSHQLPNGVQGQQNGGFQHVNGANQAGTMAAQQTPLIAHSSPMVGQNGFPMAHNSSQGAGSPPRPASAVMANGVGMARGASQQTHNSMHNTPHIQQNGTPALPNAVPNRNMNQTPHLNPSSPMVGTPGANMPIANQRSNAGLDSVQQNLMLQQMQHNNQQANGGQNMVNGQINVQGNSLSPENFTLARQMARLQEMAKTYYAQAQQAAAGGNQNLAGQYSQRAHAAQAQFQALRAKLLQNNTNMANGASGGNHSHPTNVNGHMVQANGTVNGQHQPNNAAMLNQQAQQAAMQQAQAQGALTPQQQQQILRARQELSRLLQQHNGNIPAHIVQQFPPTMQNMLRQHRQQQMQQAQAQAQARGQAQARMNMQMGNQGSPALALQNMQAMRNTLAMQMQGQQANGQGMNGNVGMNMANMPQFAGQRQQGMQQNNGDTDLSQSFAAMQSALARQHAGP